MSSMLSVLMSALVIAQKTNTANEYYTVRQGDTMWRIAQRYGVSLPALISANPQIPNPDLIYPGQQVLIPGNTTGGNEPGENAGNTDNQDNGSAERSFEEQVVDLINNERIQRGLNPLSISRNLQEVAGVKSQDMYANNYFSHNSPTYGTPFEMLNSFGVSYRTAAENIAQGQRTPESVVNAWMNSAGHRDNILNANFTETGVGYVPAGGTTYWTQLFTG